MARQINALNVTDYMFGAGVKERIPVDTVSITNVDLATDLESASIGGYTVAVDNRVLLTGQTTSTENGVYIIKAGTGNTIRASDYDTGENVAYTFLAVKLGTYASSNWLSVAPTGSTGIVGTGDLNFKMITKAPQTTGDLHYTLSSKLIGTLSKPSVTSVLQMDSSGNPTWIDKNSIMSGLDAKESVRFDTLTNITGASYSSVGGSLGTGSYSNVDFTSNIIFNIGVKTVNVNDRILVRHQTDPKQNGIYTVLTNGATGTMERSFDFYNASTISGGAFTFVEQDAKGWVLQGEGQLTPNTDNLTWVQFSESTVLTAGNGIDITNTVISANLKTNGGIVFENTNELALDLGASSITGTLAVTDGGTGVTSLTQDGLLLGNGTSNVTTLNPSNYKTVVVDGTTTYQLSNTIYAETINNSSNNTVLTFTSDPSPGGNINISNAPLDTNTVISVIGTSTDAGIDFQGKGLTNVGILGTADTAGTLRLYENTANGSNYVALKSAEDMPANVTFILPTETSNDSNYLTDIGDGELAFVSLASKVPRDVVLVSDPVVVNNASNIDLAYFPYTTARYGSSVGGQIIYEFLKIGSDMDIEIYDYTANASLASATITASGFYTLAFTSPSADSRLAVRVKKNGSGSSGTLYGVSLHIR